MGTSPRRWFAAAVTQAIGHQSFRGWLPLTGGRGPVDFQGRPEVACLGFSYKLVRQPTKPLFSPTASPGTANQKSTLVGSNSHVVVKPDGDHSLTAVDRARRVGDAGIGR